MSTAISAHVAGRVRVAMAELTTQGDRLVALGTALQELASLPGSASAGEVQHVAISVRATALGALGAAHDAALVGEALAVLAKVLEVES